MDEKTFLAALSRFPKVRDRSYQGPSCLPVESSEKSKKKLSNETANQRAHKSRNVDKRHKEVLEKSPFFKKLAQLIVENSKDKSADTAEVFIKEYERFLGSLNLEDCETLGQAIS